ncbi:NAD(P)H-hydrate epimerase [Neotabrizicola sp. VNH66]|uniref:NAD(P)H-hydrate epimerase n=1 Tax=Neotabrizicola sp. VNH66 TaxID=3400918 RepID=UPI003BFE5034
MELLTAAQMRAVEAAAIASGRVTGLELMERAGRGVVEAIFEEWPELAAAGEEGALPPSTAPGSIGSRTDGEPTDPPPEYLDQEERGRRAVVLCGPGNNGGDGFVVARLLKELGWAVEVFLYGDPEKMPPDARVNYQRWVGMGEVSPYQLRKADFWKEPGLIIDAVFGTGLKRPLTGEAWEFVRTMARGADVSIDLPSGYCADSGRYLAAEDPEAFDAPSPQLVVTFQRPRQGHWLDRLSRSDARLVTVDIGLERFVPRRQRNAGDPGDPRILSLTTRATARRVHDKSRIFGENLPSPHKYTHGHALVLSGPSGRGGAARLAARGSLRIGAGVVTVGCPPGAIPENAARLDAVMLRAVADGAALAAVLEDRRINALCLGPGMGTGVREAGLLAAALGVLPPSPAPLHAGEGRRGDRPLTDIRAAPDGLSDEAPGASAARLHPPTDAGEEATHGQLPVAVESVEELPLPLVGRGEGRGAAVARRNVVLDADALTLLSRTPALMGALHQGCVLTPHAGEFARLFPDIAEKLAAPATRGPAYSKVDATREAAARAGCVVLFKGPDTVIAGPDGRCAINSAAYERAAPWLATAGSGDVLAGFITGLLARGFAPFHAACTAAWLHVECARSFGPGLIAEDLPEELPKVFRAMGM